jgi:DNA replication protein DnaD
MLEKLFLDGYLNVSKLILDYQKELELTPNDVIVLLKILDGIKVNKRIRITKLSQETLLPKSDVELSLEHITNKKLYGTIITTNEDGIADERPTIKPLFDTLEDLLKKSQLLSVEAELKAIVSLFEEGVNRPITPAEYNKIESFIQEGFLPAEIEDSIKATIKKGNTTMNSVERTMIKNHHNMLEEPKEEKKSSGLKKAFEMIK